MRCAAKSWALCLLALPAACNEVLPPPDAGPGFDIPDAGPGFNGWSALSIVAGQAGQAGWEDGTGVGARLSSPAGVAATPGAVYFADSANHVLRALDLDSGVVRTLAGTPQLPGGADGVGEAAAFDAPAGLALVDGGVLFVADSANDAIRRVDLSTLAVTTFAGALGQAGSADGPPSAARFDRPQAVAFDGVGALFVADTGNDTVRRIDLATGAVTTEAGSPGDAGWQDGAAALFHAPAGIAATPDGRVFVADTGNAVLRLLSDGGVTTLAGSAGVPDWADGPAAESRFDRPAGLWFDGAWTLYVADTGNSALRAFDLDGGGVLTFAGSPGSPNLVEGPLPAGLAAPVGVCLGAQGQLLASDLDVLVEVR